MRIGKMKLKVILITQIASVLYISILLMHLQGLCFYPSPDSSIIWSSTAVQGYNNISTQGSLATVPKERPSLWWSASHNREAAPDSFPQETIICIIIKVKCFTKLTLLFFLQLPSCFQTPLHRNSHSFLDLQIIWFFWKLISNKPERESRYSSTCDTLSQSLDKLPWCRYQDVK